VYIFLTSFPTNLDAIVNGINAVLNDKPIPAVVNKFVVETFGKFCNTIADKYNEPANNGNTGNKPYTFFKLFPTNLDDIAKVIKLVPNETPIPNAD
jgi:hypothetical protein